MVVAHLIPRGEKEKDEKTHASGDGHAFHIITSLWGISTDL
jgi:hypothetical protein